MARILCLDDDKAIATMVASVVRYCGHEPVVCLDSSTAIIQYARAGFGAAIVDLLMPKLSGVEVLAAFQEGSPTCRRVLLTAAPDEAEVLEACKGDEPIVQLVISKPPTIDDLRLALMWLK